MSVAEFEKLSWNQNLVFCSPDFEGTGTRVRDISRYHHVMTITGAPTWTALPSGRQVLSYGGLADYLQCPAADSVALNFVAEDWTMLAWIKGSVAAGSADMIFCQGAVDVCGWEYYIFWDNGTIALRTNQAGAHTGISAVGAVVTDVWALVGVTRQGAAGQFYVNGAPVTTILNGGLTNPVSAAGGRKFFIGVGTTEVANHWNGYIGEKRIYSRALTAAEMALLFIQSKGDYGL
jgi:hypothetical protein